jgi:hypothetical protein
MDGTRRAQRGWPIAAIAGVSALVFAAVLFVVPALTSALGSPSASSIQEAQRIALSEYRGWTVAAARTNATDGQGEPDHIVLALKSPGPEDFYVRADYGLTGSAGAERWATYLPDPLFRDPAYATPFIAAFTAHHPEPGLLIAWTDVPPPADLPIGTQLVLPREWGPMKVAFMRLDALPEDGSAPDGVLRVESWSMCRGRKGELLFFPTDGVLR